jgi:hypothetical protein
MNRLLRFARPAAALLCASIALSSLGTMRAYAQTAPIPSPSPASKATPWGLTWTYADKGLLCLVKFSTPADGVTLAMDNRTTKESSTARAYFSLGNLPSLASVPKGVLQGVQVAIGTDWTTTVEAAWTASSEQKGAKLTFIAAPAIDAVVQPIAAASTLSITVPQDGGPQTFTFDLTGSGKVMAGYRACLASGSAQEGN